MSNISQKDVAYAIQLLQTRQLNECLDGANLESRPTAKQWEIGDGLGKYRHRYVRAGNQCQPEGSLILTPSGLVEIQNIKPGDWVYDECGQPIEVEAVFDNGEAEVVELINRGIVWGESTLNHVWLTTNSSFRTYKEQELCVEAFQRDTQVIRVEVETLLGNVNEPHSYILGALLGDGCSRSSGILVSSEDSIIPDFIGKELNCEVTAPKQGYSWRVKGSPKINHYDEWCKDRYAHEKTCDIEIIKTWNRESLLKFIAGLVDTDGSVYVDSWNNLTIRLEMQALHVIEAFKYACLALWQTPVSITVNDREKFVNGPTYSVKVSSNAFSKRIVKELSQFILTPRKQWKEEYNQLESKRSSSEKVALKIGRRRIAHVYDIRVKSERSLYLTATGLVTHNSGKSQWGRREAAWVFLESHPKWKRPENWGTEPLTMIILGRDNRQIVESLWKGIKALLPEGSYKENMSSGALQSVTNTKNGNTIIFISHENANQAAERSQSYTAHWVWLDEMPATYKLIEELHRRVQAKQGFFLFTMTPKVINQKIRKLVDSAQEPLAKVYRMHTFDNPIYTEEMKQEVLMSLSSYAESYKKTILEGDWSMGEEMVYMYDPELMRRDITHKYSPTWRHVYGVDPAQKSKLGYSLWAEDPEDGLWYNIKAGYIDGLFDPVEYVKKAEELVKGYNVIKRISDTAPWFITTASSLGYKYLAVYKKANRKAELIKSFQNSLGSKLFLTDWSGELEDEISSCRWSETASDKIVNSSSFHIIDSCQYVNDMLPKYDPAVQLPNWQAQLEAAHEKRKMKEAKIKHKRLKSSHRSLFT